jgi:hypothetical protein
MALKNGTAPNLLLMALLGLLLLCTPSLRTSRRTIPEFQDKAKTPIIRVIPNSWLTNMESARPMRSSPFHGMAGFFAIGNPGGRFNESKTYFATSRSRFAIARRW